MIKIKIDASGAQRKLRSVGKALDERETLTQIGNSVLGWIDRGFKTGGHGKWKRLAPNTIADKGHSSPLIRSGKLAGSFRSKVFGDRVVIGTADPKAPYHEFGTKAHTIRPRSQSLLRFMTKAGPVSAKSVNHPGNPARPMLPDEATAKGLAIDVVNKMVAQATKK